MVHHAVFLLYYVDNQANIMWGDKLLCSSLENYVCTRFCIQSSCCNILKHEIHAKSKYNYLPGYTNSLTKTNLLMMFTTIIIACSENCNVPIFSSHTLHQGCTNPRCLGVGCSVYVVRLLKRDMYSSIWMGWCTAGMWNDPDTCVARGWSKWCLHLVAHGLHFSANTVVLISALLIVTAH
jgi:hypothetical protein